MHWSPLYPFGHGLGYTTFEYGEPTVERARVPLDDPRQVVRVRVTNTGPRAGTEVVQLNLRDDVASVTRPVRELRGFQRWSCSRANRARSSSPWGSRTWRCTTRACGGWSS